jgi:hypothetical protein
MPGWSTARAKTGRGPRILLQARDSVFREGGGLRGLPVDWSRGEREDAWVLEDPHAGPAKGRVVPYLCLVLVVVATRSCLATENFHTVFCVTLPMVSVTFRSY